MTDSPAKHTRSQSRTVSSNRPFAGSKLPPLTKLHAPHDLKSRALVTGSNGWLASTMVAHLKEEGVWVRGFDIAPKRSDSEVDEFIKGDLTVYADVLRAVEGVDTVFHVASLVFAPDAVIYKVNVTGTQTLIDACCVASVRRLVYTSSGSVVFDGFDIVNGNEDLPYASAKLDMYNDTKATAEKLVLAANGKENGIAKGLRTTAIRPHSIYGPGDPLLFPSVADQARRGSFKYRIYDQTKRSSFSYVKNVAYAQWLAAVELMEHKSKAAGNVYNINDGDVPNNWDRTCSIAEAVGVSRSSMGVGVRLGKVTPFTLRLITTDHFYDISRAKRDLDYEPLMPPEESWKLSLLDLQKRYSDKMKPNSDGKGSRVWMVFAVAVVAGLAYYYSTL